MLNIRSLSNGNVVTKSVVDGWSDSESVAEDALAGLAEAAVYSVVVAAEDGQLVGVS